MAFRNFLTDARHKDCSDILPEAFNIGKRGQYVKIFLETYFGYGAGLQYLDIATEANCYGMRIQENERRLFLNNNEKNTPFNIATRNKEWSLKINFMKKSTRIVVKETKKNKGGFFFYF